jgi:hypothetical protein
MPKPQSEENDLPFTSNDFKDRPGTMGKALDTADAPGKADSEMGDEDHIPREGEQAPRG